MNDVNQLTIMSNIDGSPRNEDGKITGIIDGCGGFGKVLELKVDREDEYTCLSTKWTGDLPSPP